jgi:hypothetical protein
MQQQTDINYGLFKDVIWRNLAKIAMTCYTKGITMSLGTSTYGLIVYGGVCPDSGVTLENTWSEVGIVPFTKKYLTNKKVCHDATDKDYPNFDIFQDIQSQNNFSTTQLSLMGYKGDALKSQFMENTIWERQAAMTVMICERQEAIAAANMHGKKCFVTGGEHVTSNDMFKAAEINRQTAEAAELENGKKSWVKCHLRRKAALPILECLVNDLENNVGQQTSKELEMLLWWKGVPVLKMGNIANRCILYQQFAEGGMEEVSIPALWTENDLIELNALRNAPIDIEIVNTSYGCFLTQHKRDMEQAYQKMSAKKKVNFKQKNGGDLQGGCRGWAIPATKPHSHLANNSNI